MIFKKCLQLNLTTGFILCTVLVKAQTPNYMPIVNRQIANTQFDNFMLRPMNLRYGPATIQKHIFKVILKDSSEITIFARIISERDSVYLFWEDKNVKKKDTARFKKLYPSQTQYITRADNDSAEYTGIANDSCWLFKTITGKITAYSPVADKELTRAFISYIQKENGALLEMNTGNLEEMVKENENALNLFRKKKYEKAILKYNKESK